MVVTRAIANFSKNHALLMCRIWKMGWIFFHHWTSEKIPFLYFFLHKSWIWQTLGHVTKKNSYRHFYNASKECFWPKNFLNFMHGFKSAILAIFHLCQNGTFEPMHEIQKFFGQKHSFEALKQEKVQKGDFLWCPMMKTNFNPFFRFYTSRVHYFC